MRRKGTKVFEELLPRIVTTFLADHDDVYRCMHGKWLHYRDNYWWPGSGDLETVIYALLRANNVLPYPRNVARVRSRLSYHLDVAGKGIPGRPERHRCDLDDD